MWSRTISSRRQSASLKGGPSGRRTQRSVPMGRPSRIGGALSIRIRRRMVRALRRGCYCHSLPPRASALHERDASGSDGAERRIHQALSLPEGAYVAFDSALDHNTDQAAGGGVRKVEPVSVGRDELRIGAHVALAEVVEVQTAADRVHESPGCGGSVVGPTWVPPSSHLQLLKWVIPHAPNLRLAKNRHGQIDDRGRSSRECELPWGGEMAQSN